MVSASTFLSACQIESAPEYVTDLFVLRISSKRSFRVGHDIYDSLGITVSQRLAMHMWHCNQSINHQPTNNDGNTRILARYKHAGISNQSRAHNRSCSKANALFLQSQVPLAHESRNETRKRVWQEAQEGWKSENHQDWRCSMVSCIQLTFYIFSIE